MTTDDINSASAEATTLTELLAAYAEGGFTSNFSAVEGGSIECHECLTHSPSGDVAMSSLRRLEGASDPADAIAVVALTCPSCASRGTAVLAYGPAASKEDSDVLAVLRDHRGDTRAPGNSAPGEVAGDDTTAP